MVHTFLLAGITIPKLEQLTDLLEENGYRLTDRQQMTDIVPFILSHEKEILKVKYQGRD